MSGAEARGLAAAARRLRRTRLVGPALAAGELCAGQAKALAAVRLPRVEAIFDAHEQALLDAAGPLSVDDTARLARQWLAQADQDGADPGDDEQTARLAVTLDGRGRLEATLAPDGTLLVRSVLHQIMNELYQADKDAGEAPKPAARRRADALVEMARRASAAGDDKPAARPLIVVRCDLSELFLRSGWQTGQPAASRLFPQDEPGGGRDDDGTDRGDRFFAGGCGQPVTDDGHPLRPSFFRQLLCDADVVRVLVDGPSTILDVGRAERTATVAQRRGLLARDGGCVFPGCDRPPGWCQAHHIHWWDDGGPTDIDNLALLCNRHHHDIHRGAFTLRRTSDGHLAFTRADGSTLIAPVGGGCQRC